ncbi:MAG: zinc-binding dehydrogenase [Acidimicrobiaceae bacterium]|nr:zinc-binding dehydrogenase [Acidimicrobiaceae bacterium]
MCSTRNVEMVRALGADTVIDYLTDDFVEGGARFDVMMDNVGNRSPSACLSVLRPGARRGHQWPEDQPVVRADPARRTNGAAFRRADPSFHHFTASPVEADLVTLGEMSPTGPSRRPSTAPSVSRASPRRSPRSAPATPRRRSPWYRSEPRRASSPTSPTHEGPSPMVVRTTVAPCGRRRVRSATPTSIPTAEAGVRCGSSPTTAAATGVAGPWRNRASSATRPTPAGSARRTSTPLGRRHTPSPSTTGSSPSARERTRSRDPCHRRTVAPTRRSDRGDPTCRTWSLIWSGRSSARHG